MSRGRERRRRVWVYGMLAGLVGMFAVGCHGGGSSDGPSHGRQLYRQYSASGERVLLRRADGGFEAKLRERERGYKVYGPDLVPLGFVYAPQVDRSTGSADAGAGESGSVRVRRLIEAKPVELTANEGGSWGLGERLRLERTGRGLAVFGPEADWLGRFERTDEERWRLVRGSPEDRVWSVESDGRTRRLVSDGKTRLTVDEPQVADEILLAFGLEELTVLERVAVGVWLRGRAGDSEPTDG